MRTRSLSREGVRGDGPLTFNDVMREHVPLQYFKKFCLDDLSAENLLCWLELQEYLAIRSDDLLAARARKLFDRYLAPDAPMAVAIAEHEREAVAAQLEGGPLTQGSFDSVRRFVDGALRHDVFPRFARSDLHAQLVELQCEQSAVVTCDDFDLHRFLGAGGFGMVLLCRRKATRRYYAVKVIDKRIVISQNQIHSIFREREVLATVEHPFLVTLQFAFQTADHLCMCLDFVEGGNMFTDLMNGPYNHERTRHYAAQVVLALEHLHSLNILYRDLKPDNVLLDYDGRCKLADMGAARGIADNGQIRGDTANAARTAKRVDPTKERQMTITGTHGYRAPEVYDRVYGKPSDWWNVGILIHEMLTGENPLRGNNRKESEYLTKYKKVRLPSFMTPETQQVILAFLEHNQWSRLGTPQGDESGAQGAAHIKRHPYFADTPFDKILSGEPIDEYGRFAPFECDFEKPKVDPQRPLTEETNCLDYFCQTVDYMKTSMSMRSTWPLKDEDQGSFADFDFVSTAALEDELDAASSERAAGGGAENCT